MQNITGFLKTLEAEPKQSITAREISITGEENIQFVGVLVCKEVKAKMIQASQHKQILWLILRVYTDINLNPFPSAQSAVRTIRVYLRLIFLIEALREISPFSELPPEEAKEHRDISLIILPSIILLNTLPCPPRAPQRRSAGSNAKTFRCYSA